MQTLQAQVRQLISGSTNGVATEVPQDYIHDFLTRGAEFVIKLVPKELLMPFTTETLIPDAGLSLSGIRLPGLINVRVGDYICRKVTVERKALYYDSSSLFYVPTGTKNPVFFEFNGKVYVAPLESGEAYATHVNVDDVTDDVTTLLGELDDAIVFYASAMASKSLYNYHVQQNEDSELASLHKTSANEFLTSASTAAQSYMSGKGLSLQQQGGGQA